MLKWVATGLYGPLRHRAGDIGMETYDYIVVGAGSAGCVLASRLSEDPTIQVLLLEAGGSDSDLRITTPGLMGTLWRTEFDWAYKTAPQSALDGREMYWPRGRVLGGCSSINYMIYMRGHRANYDAWAAAGNAGWSYADVLPYFKRSEDNVWGACAYHGSGGPLRVDDVAGNPLSDVLIDATASALEVPPNPDFNGADQYGVGRFQATIRDNRRASAASSFLGLVQDRTNLTIVTNAVANQVLIEQQRAVGVRFQVANTVQTARAQREVLLCAGAIGSPQLLLLSGVGPAAHLQALEIPVQQDLPGVGENLQDHITTQLVVEDKAQITNDVQLAHIPDWLTEHAATGGGPLASNVGEGGAFVYLPDSDRTQPPPIQLHYLPVGTRQINFDQQNYEPSGHAFSLIPTLLYPKSRGRVRLRSALPTEPPDIDPAYFSDEEGADLATLIGGIKLAQQVLRSPALDHCRGQPLNPLVDLKDGPELRRQLKQYSGTIFHPVGTCKMGSDPASVVDAQLRVHGIEGLRVVDASIMPTIVGGNTNAPVLMIAERAADLIRQSP